MAREDSQVRIGIVGAGANTVGRHIPGLSAIDGVELVGVCNRSIESSRNVCERFGIRKTYQYWREVVEDDEVDAVVIGTWPYMHCPVTLAALAAGKHVLCEARMAMDAGEARDMLEASRARPDLVAQLVPAPITLNVDNYVRRLLADGYLGDVLAVDVVDAGSFIDREAPLHWREDATLSGLNTMTLGIWYETVMRWLGPAVGVSASARMFVKTRVDADGMRRAVEVPDHVEAVADMACGAQARFLVSRVCGLGGPEALTVFGSEGTIRFSQGTLYCGQKGGSLEPVVIPADMQRGWRVEEDFVNAIRGREQVKLTTFETGLRYMEFTEAVHISSAEHRTVSLPLSSR